MSGRLADRIAIVTGGGQGIGERISQRFCEEGAKVVIAQRTSAVGEAHARALRAAGYEAIFVRTDISNPKQVDALVVRTAQIFGAPDVLVNNAGVDVFGDPMEISDEEWTRCLAVNLDGAWYTTRAVLPAMLERGRGSIVNIASIHAVQIIPGCFPYPIAKHALVGMTRALAVEYGALGIRVNAVCPAYVETEGTTAYWASFPDPEAERRRAGGLHPIGRVGVPDEVAWPVVFLASDEASFINGATLMVDGGMEVVVNGHGVPFVQGVGPTRVPASPEGAG